VILTILYRMFATNLAVRLRKTTEELAEAKNRNWEVKKWRKELKKAFAESAQQTAA